MNDTKYVGLDVHQATISVGVLHSIGKLLMEFILETKAAVILQFVQGFLLIGKNLRRREQIVRNRVTTQTCQPRP
jgi:hypothetical protein